MIVAPLKISNTRFSWLMLILVTFIVGISTWITDHFDGCQDLILKKPPWNCSFTVHCEIRTRAFKRMTFLELISSEDANSIQ